MSHPKLHADDDAENTSLNSAEDVYIYSDALNARFATCRARAGMRVPYREATT